MIYELPFGKGRQFLNNVPNLMNYVVGGWEWSNRYGWPVEHA